MKNVLLLLAIVGIVLIGGSYDYQEQVIYNMPNGTYRAMKAQGMSDRKIASEYVKDAAKWDSIGVRYVCENGED
jgi:hypothetical protein